MVGGNSSTIQYTMLIKFNINDTIPNDAEIEKAVLTLYVTDRIEEAINKVLELSYSPVLDSWDFSIVSYYNRIQLDPLSPPSPWSPAGGEFGDIIETPTYIRSANQTYEIILDKAMVQNWLVRPTNNYGIAIQTAPADGKWAKFATSEYSVSMYHRPLLTVFYSYEM